MKTVFQTDDGVIFKDKNLALDHERFINNKHTQKKQDFLNRYSGKKLLDKHSLDEYGIWEVRGESPNCDFSGSHYQSYFKSYSIKHKIVC